MALIEMKNMFKHIVCTLLIILAFGMPLTGGFIGFFTETEIAKPAWVSDYHRAYRYVDSETEYQSPDPRLGDADTLTIDRLQQAFGQNLFKASCWYNSFAGAVLGLAFFVLLFVTGIGCYVVKELIESIFKDIDDEDESDESEDGEDQSEPGKVAPSA